MENEHFIVVVYDLSDDKRRTRLHKRLKDFGTPVQYSVFECLLKTSEITRMKAAINKIIRPRLDHVRYYDLCATCRGKIEVLGRREVSDKPDVIVV